MADETVSAEDAERHVKPFAEFLQNHRWGALHSKLSEELNRVILGVVQHGKVGSLTLTLKVSPAPSGEFTVYVADDVKTKVPEGTPAPALFFVDDAGNLCKQDPRQRELPGLRSVDGPEQIEPRDVSGHGG